MLDLKKYQNLKKFVSSSLNTILSKANQITQNKRHIKQKINFKLNNMS